MALVGRAGGEGGTVRDGAVGLGQCAKSEGDGGKGAGAVEEEVGHCWSSTG